jgi:hypothetical protein
LGWAAAPTLFPGCSSSWAAPLAFARVHRQIARHENRHQHLHLRLDYSLTSVGGAVFFIPEF